MRVVLLSVVSVVLGAAGCGGCDDDSRRNLPDAPPPIDAAIDAPDAGVKPVTLTITKNGAPVSGVHVYFLDADNSLVKATDTDATGKASAIMDPGGSVTAIDPFPPDPPVPGVVAVIVGNNDLRTFAGVKPGDELVLTRADPQRIGVTLQIPSDPLASNYEVGTTCGAGTISTGGGSATGASGVLTLQNCGAMVDFLVVAIDDETGRPRSALHRQGVAVTDGATVDLTAETFQALSDVTFRFTNVPEVGFLAFDHILVSSRGPLAVPFGGSVTLDGGAGMTTLREPVVGGTSSVLTTNLFTASRHHVIDWGAASPTYTLDLAGRLLPTLDFASYEATDRKLTWLEGDTGATPDLTIAGIDVSAASERTWRWVIAAPYRRGQLTFPTLPTDIASWAPGPQDDVRVDRQINVRVTGGYDAVRSRVLDVREALFDEGALIGFVSGPTGRADLVQPDSVEVRRSR